MDAVLFISQLIIILLWLTNQYLTGSSKAEISQFLGALWAGCVVAAPIWFGWDGVGFAVASSLLGPVILRGPAARLAAWLSSLPNGGARRAYPGPPPSRLLEISRVLGDFSYLGSLERTLEVISRRGPDPKDEALRQLIHEVTTRPGTKAVLNQCGIAPAQLKDLYAWLSDAGAAQWAGAHFAAASALYYPSTLVFVLHARDAGISPLEVAYALITHFRRGSPIPSVPGGPV